MSKKIKLFSQLKYELQSEIKDCVMYGMYAIFKVTHNSKLVNAIRHDDLKHQYLVILDSINLDDFEDDFENDFE